MDQDDIYCAAFDMRFEAQFLFLLSECMGLPPYQGGMLSSLWSEDGD